MTGSWVAGRGVARGDLDEALTILAGALLAGFEPGELATPAFGRWPRAPETPQRQQAIAALVDQSQPQDIRPFVRQASDLEPGARGAIAGMKITRTLGPFVDNLGVAHFVDLIALPRKIPVEGTPGILAWLIVDVPLSPVLQPPPQKIQLGAGSLWVSVRALAGGLATGVVGLAFSHAVAELVNVHHGPGGSLLLQAGSSLTLTLTLAPPAPAALTSSIGRDAAQMAVALPAHVTIVFTASGARIAALDPSSATVYGTSVGLTRNTHPPRVEDFGLPYLVVPCDVSVPSFAVTTCLSTDFAVARTAPLNAGGWALVIANAPPAGLGAAAGAGALLLQLGAGVSARFGSIADGERLSDVALFLQPGSILIIAHSGHRETHDRLRLWDPPSPGVAKAVPPPIRRISEINLTYRRGAFVVAAIAPNSEIVVASCSAVADLDRPLAADGARLPLAYDSAVVGFVDVPTGKNASVTGEQPPQHERGRVVALENGLLATRPSNLLMFQGQPRGNRYAGMLVLWFPLGGIVPTLPDPYAASFATPQLIDTGIGGSLIAALAWRHGAVPGLNFTVGGNPQQLIGGFTLLDLSTNADQFGVSAPALDPLALAIDVQALATRDSDLTVYALPGISWEPVVNNQPQEPLGWHNAFSPDDGPPIELLARSVDLVRIEPLVTLAYFEKIAASVPTSATFTLPFGLMANMSADPQGHPDRQPTFGLIKATFPRGLAAASQLSIRAGAQSVVGTAALPGTTTTGSGAPPPLNSSVYGDEVLGDIEAFDAAQFFNSQFAIGNTAEIPVDRIDLSGYGTSMYSDWRIDDDFVGVVRARFDVLVGRTAYELAQIQTVIAHWGVRITRTIIFDRFDTGLVVRNDSGWKAIGDATFGKLAPDQILPGAVKSLVNVHNIRAGSDAPIEFVSPDTPDYQPGFPKPPPLPPVPPPGPRTIRFVPVLFDADVVIDSTSVAAEANGSVTTQVAATNIEGWAQMSPGYSASAAEILTLMDKVGPGGLSGSLGCVLTVNQGAFDPNAAQFKLNVSSLSATATRARTAGQTYAAAVAVALHGAPRLPRDGAWSIARRANGADAPTAVDPSTPIPLILGKLTGVDQWRLLDPVDALSIDTPANFYGILQGTGSSKTFFEHPIIDPAGTALNLDNAHLPNLADVGALLGATDIFPNLGAVLSLNQQPGPLGLSGDGLKQTYQTDPTKKPDDRTIFDLGVIKIVLSYASPNGPMQATFKLDPAASPRWSIDILSISFNVMVDGFGPDPLLTIYGNFSASETQKAGFNDIQVDYGPALGLVKDVLSGLGPLIESVGGKVDLEVGFTQGHLTVRDYLAVPTIPLGFGDIHDITLELGFDAQIPSNAAFHVGLGSKEKPFTWLVSPLSGTGAIVLGVDKGDIDVFIEAGIGVGLAIDVAVASGAASITLELAIIIEGSQISIGVTLLGQAEVSVLGGVASASLMLAASITVTPRPALPQFPPTDIEMTAAVAVGIHISICWVVSLDFDGSWQFTQDIPV